MQKTNIITTEQELIVRKHVSSIYFNVENFIEYLNNNEIISMDIFTENMLRGPKQGVQFTYLQSYKPVSKDTFIRRIPVYFYGLNNNSDVIDISDLFASYGMYIKNYNSILNDDESEMSLIFSSNDFRLFDYDFEPVYVMLERNYWGRKIPLEKILEYLYDQIGQMDFEIFQKWCKYVDLLKEINEDNLFPNNILYAYNVELVANGLKPIIYYPSDFKVLPPTQNGRKFVLQGKFPIDNNNEPCLEWIGLWYENIETISIRNRVPRIKNIPAEIIRSFESKLIRNSIIVELKNDSIIYVAKNKFDKFEGEYQTIWEQAYCGAKCMKFDYSVIVKVRERLKISQKEMAEDLDINLRTFQRIEAGESTPDALNLIKMMNYLGLDSYEEFIYKKEIYDDEFKKFRAGLKPSDFLNCL